MRSFRKATIKDVAKHAAVSTTTVSRFLNDASAYCSPETTQRIQKAVQELHYTPSFFTQGLRPRETKILGVCVFHPYDCGTTEIEPQTAGTYFDLFWGGLIASLNQANYSLLHYPPSARNISTPTLFLDGHIDGLLYEMNNPQDSCPALMVKAGMPIVVLSSLPEKPEGCGWICSDEEAVVGCALDHLWSLGHRRIAHLAGPEHLHQNTYDGLPIVLTSSIAMRRREAWKQFMVDHTGSPVDLGLLAVAPDWETGADEAAQQAASSWRSLRDPPTAVLCANDVLGEAMLRAAAASGWSVPETLSVVGIDNRSVAKQSVPALTTIDVGIIQLGQAAGVALLNRVQGHPLEECQFSVMPPGLVIRDSTAPCQVETRRV